ncbi:hypothetical protein ACFQRC_04150 [Enterovirga sp. GCM10030262]|uniref:hypothetical protein n=1 Tax=Enterovirga sp. GCM10030262 TaxID=3273391 RepID=UPI00362053A8
MRIGLSIAALMLAPTAAVAAAPALPRIVIDAAAEGVWTVRYRLDAPATRLVFRRSPDQSRQQNWAAESGFEIVATPAGEAVRRIDGRPFAAVSLTMPPLYRELPKDYAPFAPFGDGGTLFHSGRMFACAEACPEDAQWRMRVNVPDGRAILVDGERKLGAAEWIDRDSGRNIYVGAGEPVATADLLALIDGALPATIRDPLMARLPAFMRHFASKFGTLPARPMLFASYDAGHQGGWGRQGGTLPGQVFTHFYGAHWAEEMAKPGFGDELSWFFAHEAAHLYQRQLFTPAPEGAWIHEGGAEALAVLATRETEPRSAAFLAAKIEGADKRCTELLDGASVRDAIAAGRFEAAYSCGLLLNLALDAALRRAAPDGDGLYSLWRDYMARAGDKGSEHHFLAAIASAGGAPLAEAVRAAVRTPRPDFTRLGG